MYKGALTFGLVYIPITLSPAVREHDVGFNMLDKKTLSRVKYKKTCAECMGREIGNDEIVKGYEYERGKYVIFTAEDFEKLKSERDKNITITEFVDLAAVDPIYYDKTYYICPTGGEHAYALLIAAMEKQNRAAIAKTVLGTRETLLLVRVRNGVMIGNTLFFADEIQRPTAVPKPKIQAEELALASNLINNMLNDFAPEKYRDEYTDRVRAAIADKVAGKELTAPASTAPENVINIMDALKKSVEMTKPKTAAR